jgi:hypothetical protein
MNRPAPKPAARRHPLDEAPIPAIPLRAKSGPKLTALNVKIPAPLHERLRVDAAKSRQHIAGIVADALAAWYEAHPDRGV